jgi:excisionase family DNA binding protein
LTLSRVAGTVELVEKLLTAEQVADVLGLRPKSVYDLARQGRIPVVRISRRAVRFDPADVAGFVAKHRVAAIA